MESVASAAKASVNFSLQTSVTIEQTAVSYGQNMPEIEAPKATDATLNGLPPDLAEAVTRLDQELDSGNNSSCSITNTGNNFRVEAVINGNNYSKGGLKVYDLIAVLGGYKQLKMTLDLIDSLRIRYAERGVRIELTTDRLKVFLSRNGAVLGGEHELASSRTRLWLRQKLIYLEASDLLEETLLSHPEEGPLVDYSTEDQERFRILNKFGNCLWPEDGHFVALLPTTVMDLRTFLETPHVSPTMG